MKKVLLGLLFMVMLALVVGYTTSSVAQVKSIELKVAHHLPPIHVQHKKVLAPWTEERDWVYRGLWRLRTMCYIYGNWRARHEFSIDY
jgi:hypothetical protein